MKIYSRRPSRPTIPVDATAYHLVRTMLDTVKETIEEAEVTDVPSPIIGGNRQTACLSIPEAKSLYQLVEMVILTQEAGSS